MPEIAHCHDCGVPEGQLHHAGCKCERCPVCGEQAIACFDHCFHLDGTERDSFLQSPDRFPFFYFALFCSKCGKKGPGIFMVSDEDWEAVVPPRYRKTIICWDCYSFMARLLGIEPRLVWPVEQSIGANE